MTTITAAEVQQLIIDKVGDIDPMTLDATSLASGLLATKIAGIWNYYQAEASVWPRLQALYTERDAIKMVMARIRVQVDINTGQSIQLRLGQKYTALKGMLDEVNAEIAYEIKRARFHGGGGAIQPITQTSPQMPPQTRPAYVDPNDPYYGGNPFFPIPEPPL